MTEPRDSYSPERRTALLFTGTGADGAYHAGAMRALQEAGVKIDLVGGRGVGALAAMLAAVDGGSQLWDAGGFWRSPHVSQLYRWRWPFTVLRWLALALLAILAIPAAVLLLGLVVYPIALLLGMAGLDAGARFVETFVSYLGQAFAPAALPTWIPRLAAFVSTAALVVLGVGAWLAWWRSPLYRRSSGSRLWTLLGSPIDAQVAVQQATDTVWHLLKGGAAIKTPEAEDLSRRYSELLAENLGQPGFRELLLVVHDLDANRDLVFGLVRDPYRRMLFPSPGSVTAARRAEAQDLSAGTQGFLADVLAAALSLPGVSETRLVKFAPDSAGVVKRTGCALGPRASAGYSKNPRPPAPSRSSSWPQRPIRLVRTSSGRRDSTASAASASSSPQRRPPRCTTRSATCIIGSRACTRFVRRTIRSARSISRAPTTRSPIACTR